MMVKRCNRKGTKGKFTQNSQLIWSYFSFFPFSSHHDVFPLSIQYLCVLISFLPREHLSASLSVGSEVENNQQAFSSLCRKTQVSCDTFQNITLFCSSSCMAHRGTFAAFGLAFGLTFVSTEEVPHRLVSQAQILLWGRLVQIIQCWGPTPHTGPVQFAVL